ncbi:MAG: hypothetical protein WBB32_06735 [Flavobacteriales bacterium]
MPQRLNFLAPAALIVFGALSLIHLHGQTQSKNHRKFTEPASKMNIVISEPDSAITSMTFHPDPIVHKCLLGALFYYLNKGFPSQVVLNTKDLQKDTVPLRYATVGDTVRNILLNRGYADPDLDLRYMQVPDMEQFRHPILRYISMVNGHPVALVCSYFVKNIEPDSSVNLTVGLSLVHDDGRVQYIQQSDFRPLPYSANLDELLITGDSLVVKLEGSGFGKDNPLFCIFRLNERQEFVLNNFLSTPQLPNSYQPVGEGYLNWWGYSRNGIYATAAAPFFYGMLAGTTYDLSKAICQLRGEEVLKNPGPHYWLNDLRVLPDGRVLILYYSDDENHLSLIDLHRRRLLATASIAKEVTYGSLGFISDSSFVGVGPKGDRLYHWNFSLR